MIDLPIPPLSISGDGEILWVAGGGRLLPIDERTGRKAAASARLSSGGMTSDGRRTWLVLANGTRTFRADLAAPGYRGLEVGVGDLLAATGGAVWIERGCSLSQNHDCFGPASLRRVSPRDPRPRAIVAAQGDGLIAGSADVLWRLRSGAGREPMPARLERRDAGTGDLTATIRLPGRYSARPPLSATATAAWVVTVRGRLVRIGTDGRVARGRHRVRALIGDGRRELWALATGNRTLIRIDPASGDERERVRLNPAFVGGVPPLALTRRHVWAVNGLAGLVRVPRVTVSPSGTRRSSPRP